MNEIVMQQQLYERIGNFLNYPLNDFREEILNLANDIQIIYPQASVYLKEFLTRMKRMELNMWQEFYVQTFDLMPQCSLYISVHLFGEESFKRAELMAGLKKGYNIFDLQSETELPDHLAVVLRRNSCFNSDDWHELTTLCILPAIPIMIGKLEKNNNPYALILKTIHEILLIVEKIHV